MLACKGYVASRRGILCCSMHSKCDHALHGVKTKNWQPTNPATAGRAPNQARDNEVSHFRYKSSVDPTALAPPACCLSLRRSSRVRVPCPFEIPCCGAAHLPSGILWSLVTRSPLGGTNFLNHMQNRNAKKGLLMRGSKL